MQIVDDVPSSVEIQAETIPEKKEGARAEPDDSETQPDDKIANVS